MIQVYVSWHPWLWYLPYCGRLPPYPRSSMQRFVKGEARFSFRDFLKLFLIGCKMLAEKQWGLIYFYIADKELTDSIVLASDWLSNINVWFGLTKRDSEKKVTKWMAKFLSFYKSLILAIFMLTSTQIYLSNGNLYIPQKIRFHFSPGC